MMPERAIYLAHSKNDEGICNPLSKHLAEVAELARTFAAVFGAGDAAHLAGLLHDLGKYGELFQRRLEGKEKGLDHWSIGASVCLAGFRNPEVALVVQGHHIGLQWWDQGLRQLIPADLPQNVQNAGKRLTEPDRGVLLQRLAADGIELPTAIQRDALWAQALPAMLDTRMLYSALTDADYLATEQHFDPAAAELRRPPAELNPDRAADLLLAYLRSLSGRQSASQTVSTLRADLLDACLSAAASPPGLFTLTAPTGAGKTLSTLAFALRHAAKNGLRRIVVVMPFLSIIDQTVKVYRDALADMADTPLDRYILEHHSLAVESSDRDLEGMRLRGLLAQNWDAPIVITTSVQILESLFSNSPSACRKLHRLANSIVIFDEVQTLPLKLVQPTLAALSHLCARYRSTVVFSTATQPAFPHLHDPVSRLCPSGWRPREIVSPELRLFERARRVRPEWPAGDARTSWEDLVTQFDRSNQVLCIVNLKRHALELFRLTKPVWGPAVFHLSTAMCPKHREAVLSEVRARLREGVPCALIATQCVEAGVDLDFPAVFRALGPLDAIAQAAGRCNRNGLLETGALTVFRPVDERYPGAAYRQATDVTKMLLNSDPGLSIDDPVVFETYFRNLYEIAAMENVALTQALNAKHFPDVREHYKIIGQDSVNVLVPYDHDRYSELASRARNKWLDRQWVQEARPHSVSCFPGVVENVFLEPLRLRDGSPARDWFVYPFEHHYDPDTGLQIPNEMELLTA
jgi:CRISPR-associated endonuclease/helicase Cas3